MHQPQKQALLIKALVRQLLRSVNYLLNLNVYCHTLHHAAHHVCQFFADPPALAQPTAVVYADGLGTEAPVMTPNSADFSFLSVCIPAIAGRLCLWVEVLHVKSAVACFVWVIGVSACVLQITCNVTCYVQVPWPHARPPFRGVLSQAHPNPTTHPSLPAGAQVTPTTSRAQQSPQLAAQSSMALEMQALQVTL